MTRCSGAKDSLRHISDDIKAISEAERGPRLHSEIAFLQDLTGVCDPARQEPSRDSIFATICKRIHDSLSEDGESFDLEILIKNSSLCPCSRWTFTDDLGIPCQEYLKLFCERVNNCDWFQQMSRGVCRIIVQIPGKPLVYIPPLPTTE